MRTLLIISFIFLQTGLWAANTKFTASAPNVVREGEHFRLTYSLEGKGNDFQPPTFDGFNVLSGPSTSTNSSVSIINGKMQQSYSYTFTYVLQAQKKGKYEIKPAKIKVDGKNIQSNAIVIEVVKGNPPSNNQSGKKTQISNIDNKNLFVRVHVNKKNVYQGEELTAVIKIYSKVNLAGFEDINLPDFAGFWTQEIETPNQISLHRENVNGDIYNVGVLKKNLLYPQRSGEIVIEPVEIECIVRQQVKSQRRSFFDDFFGSYKNVVVKTKSPKVKINVKPLPANKPESYEGAVGNLNFSADIDKTQTKTNDAVTLTVKLSGTGNIKLSDPPKIDFPPDFEVYDPKIKTNVKNTESGSRGSKTFEYLIIPRHSGKFRIPPIEFTYFNTSTKKFVTKSSKEFVIEVEKGNEEANKSVVSGYTKEDVKFIGKDIRFIKKGDIEYSKKGQYIVGTGKFYMAYIIPLLLLISILIIRRKRIAESRDVALMKNKKANKLSRKRLKKAAGYLKTGEKEPFYDEILKAMWGYLSDKLSIPVSELSRESAEEYMTGKGVDDDLVTRFLKVIDTCEFARYAPVGDDSAPENIFKEVQALLSSLDSKIK